MDFNPRSHKGSDLMPLSVQAGMVISIHAPTRGATGILHGKVGGTDISIHAPTRGATMIYALRLVEKEDFNPRSHKGSDVVVMCLVQVNKEISIHAPTRGATIRRHRNNLFRRFQSTLPQGERQQFSPILGLVLR